MIKSRNGILPQFDIISLHGVWSWITAENREEILKIISSNLKVGGVVYVGYNCMPGWADFAPMRELLLYHAKTINAAKGSVSQVQEAYGFISQLEKSKALYFQRNSSVTAKFKSLADKSVSYVAHEYLNENWYVPYFKEGVKNTTEKIKWVQNVLQNLGKNLQKEGVELSEKESLVELQEMCKNFEEQRLPFLQALCVEV